MIFNRSINHYRRILNITFRFLVRQNNKTLIKLDKFINNMCSNKLYQNKIFILFEKLEDSTTAKVAYKDSQLLCNNNHSNLLIIIPHFKLSTNMKEI